MFAFLLAVTEVNVFNAMKNIYGGKDMQQIVFRQKLAKELMHNDYIKENRDENRAMNKRSRPLVHELLTLPCGKKFKDDKIVNSKIAYSQQTCSGCTKKLGHTVNVVQASCDATSVSSNINVMNKTTFLSQTDFSIRIC